MNVPSELLLTSLNPHIEAHISNSPLTMGWQNHFRVWPTVYLLMTPLGEDIGGQLPNQRGSKGQKPRYSHRA
jgi:hypothetical protein